MEAYERKKFLERLENLIAQSGASRTDILNRAGLSDGTFKNWRKSTPNVESAIRMANALDVSLSYLLFGKSESAGFDEPTEIPEKDYLKFRPFGKDRVRIACSAVVDLKTFATLCELLEFGPHSPPDE